MDNLEHLISMNMLLVTLRMAIPLILASIGSVICERSGIINLGIEGMMLAGALGAVIGTSVFQSPWMGTLAAIMMGGVFGLIHAVFCIRYHTNQAVSGVGINIFASGLTIVLCKAIWDKEGLSGEVAQIPTVTVPFLHKIPVIGPLFKEQSPYLYITILIVAISWYVMYRTKVGLRLRTIGDHPKAASTAGVDVTKYRYIAVIVCGMLCGLSGSYLSIVQSNLFVKEMVAGRGYIALAATIFGGWNPLGSFWASLLFAFSQALRITLDLDIPEQFLQMFPYLLTMLVLILAGGKAKGPQASGDIKD
ncbi:ribose ABC transporter permease protein [[Eubacterium] contortum]|uniref:Ribose ABC transporter permease protein n=1 Tax=Faecalicatena contorta TaxID=39482 RepID=A0A173YK13_9FIRM|nr:MULTISPECIES: ABC transporter permease [Clostridia]CUN63597.1 ribose ABC transporter permease protein [[Eubacterium] contortum] [Faecalicatena contorta]